MINSEEMILAQIMTKQDIYFKISLNEEYFSNQKTRLIFRAIKKCIIELKIEPNPMNIIDIEPVISGSEIGKIYSLFNGELNYHYHEKKIISAYQRKELIKILNIRLADIKENDPKAVINSIENDISEIYRKAGDSGIKKIGDSIGEFVDIIQERAKNGNRLVGIPSGFNEFDNYFLGFQQELFYVIGARPSKGKTALILNMLANISIDNKIPIGFISAESGEKEILGRLSAIESGIPLYRIKRGELKTYEFEYLDKAFAKINESPFYIIDEPNIKLSTLCSHARKMVLTKGVKLIALDYMSIIDSELDTKFTRDKISHISITLKQLARQLKIPIIALAQLNRDAEGKRPTLANLRESGQIEQDADGIIFIWHDEDNDKSYLIIEKNRDGATGAIPVFFKKQIMKFGETEYEK